MRGTLPMLHGILQANLFPRSQPIGEECTNKRLIISV